MNHKSFVRGASGLVCVAPVSVYISEVLSFHSHTTQLVIALGGREWADDSRSIVKMDALGK